MQRAGFAWAFVLVVAGCGSSGNGSHSDAAAADAPTPVDARPGSSFDTAIDITNKIDGQTYIATLPDTATRDYYKFTVASDGARLVAGTTTDAATMQFGSVADTVLTIYDSSETAFAQDDDTWPEYDSDSGVWFETRAAGTYYLTVEDCHSAFGDDCAFPASGIVDLNYHVFINHTTHVVARETHADGSQDGTVANAQPIAYAVPSGNQPGHYGYYMLDGNFRTATDTHVFAFTPPADASLLTGTRMRAEFFVQPIGAANGDGSTAAVKAWVTATDGTTILAAANEGTYGNSRTPPNYNLDLSLPVTAGTPYYLFVQNTDASSVPATDYYYVDHFIGSFYIDPAELEGAAASGVNDTMATAELLAHPAQTPDSYFVDGNLATAADVDWFEVDPPSTDNMVGLECRAVREGAGFAGFTATLYAADGMTAIGSIGPETASAEIFADFAVPSGTAKAYLKVTATSIDTTDTGNSYRCGADYFTQ
jgi:hypothetical protein